MRRIFKISLLLFVLLLSVSAAADVTKMGDNLPSPEFLSVGIINQTISVPFKPASAYALVQTGDGGAHQFRALAIPNPDSTNARGSQTYAVAALVPLTVASDTSPVRFTFFLASVQGEFAATEVMQWTATQLREESVSLPSLQSMIGYYEREMPHLQMENANMENQLAVLRDKASRIADVDDIIDLKAELESLRGFDEKKIGELDRLKELADRGRELPEPAQVNDLRQDLAAQLVEAARVTAFADKISNTKRDMALTNYRRKVNMVKAAEGIDPEALAKEALRLRKRRKELESRLNLNSEQDSGNDQF